MVDPKKIWSSSQLPTLPTIAMRLLELARDPETEFKDVIGVVKTDPAITAKILKAANSSFFGFKSPVTSIERAVPLLGTTVVTTLALSFSLVDAAMTSGSLAQHYTAYWKHSIVQAVAAEVLAERVAKGLAGDCFLTGLLLDLGRLAMLKTVPNDYLPVLEEWEEQGGSLKEREAARLGIDHVRVGAQLMREWKLPQQLIAAVTLHHAHRCEAARGTEGSDDGRPSASSPSRRRSVIIFARRPRARHWSDWNRSPPSSFRWIRPLCRNTSIAPANASTGPAVSFA